MSAENTPSDLPTRLVPWWVHMSSGDDACVEAATAADATSIAQRELRCEALDARRLPYPAPPRVGPTTDCPSFCLHGERCAGRSSCPRDRSCCE